MPTQEPKDNGGKYKGKTEAEWKAMADKVVEITVTRTGAYAVNGNALVDNELDTLKRAIEETSGGDTALPMVITADSATPHQSVVTAMDAAGQLGFIHLSITTRNSTDE